MDFYNKKMHGLLKLRKAFGAGFWFLKKEVTSGDQLKTFPYLMATVFLPQRCFYSSGRKCTRYSSFSN